MRNTQEELRNRYNPDGSTLRKAQLRMLEMLKFIDKVCRDNDITYWLDSGTLLGAMRHGGFIPWDDDTDICMPREDMLKFKRIMLENNPDSRFVIHCYENDPRYYRFYLVLKDLGSEVFPDPGIDKLNQTYKYRGLGIDIFPMERYTIDCLYRHANKKFLSYVFYPLTAENKRYIKRKPYAGRRYRFFKFMYFPFLRALSRLFGKKPYYRMSYGCPFMSKRYLANIYPLKRTKFEDYDLPIPGNPDKYLQDLYGDWRIIPDEEHRATHFFTHIDFK